MWVLNYAGGCQLLSNLVVFNFKLLVIFVYVKIIDIRNEHNKYNITWFALIQKNTFDLHINFKDLIANLSQSLKTLQ